MDLLLFTKHLDVVGGLSLSEAAERMADIGFDGADLTVREGGYVDPDAAGTELPDAVETFAAHDLTVPMITTSIRGHTERAEAVMAAADACGVDYLKLGYWGYDGLGTLSAGVEDMAADLEEVGALASSYDVSPAVHVHSGHNLSASGVVLAEVLDDVDGVAAYPDLGHLGAEGAVAGWKMALERLAPHAAMVGVKNYGWRQTDDGWARAPIPLDEGIVDIPAALDYLSSVGFDGPLSLHAEYGESLDDLLELVTADHDYVREAMD